LVAVHGDEGVPADNAIPLPFQRFRLGRISRLDPSPLRAVALLKAWATPYVVPLLPTAQYRHGGLLRECRIAARISRLSWI